MKKTRLMKKIEAHLGENLEIFLPRKYNHENISGRKLAREFNITEQTMYRWLKLLNIPLRTLEDYIVRAPKRPPKGVLKYYYHYLGRRINDIAREREVNERTILKWMDAEGIKRRHGTNAYLAKGKRKPSKKKLEKLCQEMSREEIATLYKIHPETVGVWRRKARISKLYPSIYDKKKYRKNRLNNLLKAAGKKAKELVMRDFRNYKQENGRSYYGILTWYISRFGYKFSQAKEHFIKEFYSSQ